jgi:hypothetical protein
MRAVGPRSRARPADRAQPRVAGGGQQPSLPCVAATAGLLPEQDRRHSDNSPKLTIGRQETGRGGAPFGALEQKRLEIDCKTLN